MSDYWINAEYPDYAKELARKRIAGLLRPSILTAATLEKMLESAYLQGITDAVDVGIKIKGKGDE